MSPGAQTPLYTDSLGLLQHACLRGPSPLPGAGGTVASRRLSACRWPALAGGGGGGTGAGLVFTAVSALCAQEVYMHAKAGALQALFLGSLSSRSRGNNGAFLINLSKAFVLSSRRPLIGRRVLKSTRAWSSVKKTLSLS